MNAEELKHICDMTVELTKIKQLGCNHLSVENFAPDLFMELVKKFEKFRQSNGLIFST